MKNIINQSILLSKKYDVVVTNPPYMGNNGMNPNLKDYIKSKFPLTKTDLFAVFLEKGLEMIKDYGFNCMVTMQSWMFLSSFEKFRKKLIETTTISNLLHMDNMVMKIAFGTSATVFRKINLMNYNSTFYHVKLSDVENDIVNPLFFNDKNKFIMKKENFNSIPGNPISYWVNDSIIDIFKNSKKLGKIVAPKCGLKTGITEKYVRKWFEVDYNNIGFDIPNREMAKKSMLKWFPASNGGQYRKWYGNIEDVVFWYDDGYEIRNLFNPNGKLKSRPQNMQYYFKKGLTWSALTSKKLSLRLSPIGNIITGAGYGLFNNEFSLLTIMGFLNSKIATYFSSIFSETLNFEVGILNRMPILIKENSEINKLVSDNITISKENWDNYEFSFDFIKHPFMNFNSDLLKECYEMYASDFKLKFNELKKNEEQINVFFIQEYDLKNHIKKNVPNEDITLFKPNLTEDIKSFISYAVGCMFGRYSLDNEGLQFAGGEFNIDNYHKFIPDEDNIIPVLDSEYFEDDIVNRFVEFVKICFGEETLEENLDFIANALAKNKKPSREKIREYMLKNFFNDHKKTYKKCPIYWQFSSGKENGFNCLVYMHRYEPSLVARIRTDYLHKTQKAIEQAIANCDNIINHSSSNTEVTKATKEKSKLQKQLKETQEYDEALAHIANQNIKINLDDGVKVNYAKFQNIEVSKEGKKSKKINLLKKL